MGPSFKILISYLTNNILSKPILFNYFKEVFYDFIIFNAKHRG